MDFFTLRHKGFEAALLFYQ